MTQPDTVQKREQCCKWLIFFFFLNMVETHHRIHTTSPNLVTLKIKSEDGNHTFKLKMCFSETIGHLRQYLDKHRWDHISLRFSSFPNTTLSCFFVLQRKWSLRLWHHQRASAVLLQWWESDAWQLWIHEEHHATAAEEKMLKFS